MLSESEGFGAIPKGADKNKRGKVKVFWIVFAVIVLGIVLSSFEKNEEKETAMEWWNKEIGKE